MAVNFLHGVETIEVLKGPRPIRQVKTAVVFLVGTAPLWKVASEYQTTNELVLCVNDVQASNYFGPDTTGYTIPEALNAIFSHGAGTVICVNVFDPATHTSAMTETSKTFDATTGKLDLGHLGVSNVVVKHSSGTPTYVLDTDYTVDAATGIVTRKGSTIAAGATVKVACDYADPSKVDAADIIGTITSGVSTGLKLANTCFNNLGFAPKIIIAPGFSDDDSVAAEMVVQASKNTVRGIALVDAPVGTDVQTAIEGRGPEGSINFQGSSDRLVLCHPHLKRFSTAAEAEVLTPFSSYLAGVICATDVNKGYWYSPSNKEILGITGLEMPITGRVNSADTDANSLNEAGIVTILNSFGTGYRAWGNRSAAWPTVSAPNNFIAVRRTADVIHESLEYAMLQFIDEPITRALIDYICESVLSFMRTLAQRGAIMNEFYCKWDEAKNPVTEIAAGHLTFDISFMPPTPAERITFESFLDTNLFRALYSSRA